MASYYVIVTKRGRLKINDLKDIERKTFHLFLMCVCFFCLPLRKCFLHIFVGFVVNFSRNVITFMNEAHSFLWSFSFFSRLILSTFTDEKRIFFFLLYSQVTETLLSITNALTKYFSSNDFHFDTFRICVGCAKEFSQI